MTDSRERHFDALLDATGEATKSKAIDRAVVHYCKVAGDNLVAPQGAYAELMEQAIKQGSVTPVEIARILGTDELPVEYEHEWSIGER